MTIQELKETGAVYIDNVVHGMKHRPHEILVMDSGKAEELFLTMWKSSGEKDAFVDFYYFVLKEEEKEAVKRELTQEELAYLKTLELTVHQNTEQQELVFPISEMLLKIAVKLNEKAILFSTFYFIGEKKSTWWGNYNQEYIRFE